MSVSDESMKKVERWMNQSGEISDRVVAALDTLPLEQVREIAKLYAENVGYLGDHFPDERRGTLRFPCLGEAYHGCSFGSRHDPGCKAIGGDGDVSANGHKSARSCEADCDTKAVDERWCHVSGFDCPDCELVDKLLAILETVPA